MRSPGVRYHRSVRKSLECANAHDRIRYASPVGRCPPLRFSDPGPRRRRPRRQCVCRGFRIIITCVRVFLSLLFVIIPLCAVPVGVSREKPQCSHELLNTPYAVPPLPPGGGWAVGGKIGGGGGVEYRTVNARQVVRPVPVRKPAAHYYNCRARLNDGDNGV